MALSGEALQAAGNALTRETANVTAPKFATIATDSTIEPEVTAANARKIKVKAGTVPSSGAVCVVTNLNGKTTLGEESGGLVVGIPYYVHKVSSTELALANVKTAAESATEGEWIEFTVEIKTESRIKVLEEHTGAKTERKEVKYKAADKNLANESEGTVPKVVATTTVKARWVMYFSAVTTGTFMGCEPISPERELFEGDSQEVTSTKVVWTGYRI